MTRGMKDFGSILAGNDLGFVTGKKELRGLIQRHTLFLVIEKLFLKFKHGDIISIINRFYCNADKDVFLDHMTMVLNLEIESLLR